MGIVPPLLNSHMADFAFLYFLEKKLNYAGVGTRLEGEFPAHLELISLARRQREETAREGSSAPRWREGMRVSVEPGGPSRRPAP